MAPDSWQQPGYATHLPSQPCSLHTARQLLIEARFLAAILNFRRPL